MNKVTPISLIHSNEPSTSAAKVTTGVISGSKKRKSSNLSAKPAKTKFFTCELCNYRAPYSQRAYDEHMVAKPHRNMKLILDYDIWPGKWPLYNELFASDHEKELWKKFNETGDQNTSRQYYHARMWRERDVKRARKSGGNPLQIDGVTHPVFCFVEKGSGQIFCTACDTMCDDATELLKHQMETPHLTKLKAWAITSLPTLYYCTACDVFVGHSQIPFDNHRLSTRHQAATVAQKMNSTWQSNPQLFVNPWSAASEGGLKAVHETERKFVDAIIGSGPGAKFRRKIKENSVKIGRLKSEGYADRSLAIKKLNYENYNLRNQAYLAEKAPVRNSASLESVTPSEPIANESVESADSFTDNLPVAPSEAEGQNELDTSSTAITEATSLSLEGREDVTASNSNAVCLRCKECGHSAKNCLKPLRRPKPEETPVGDDEHCTICWRRDHRVDNCPRTPWNRKMPQMVSSGEEIARSSSVTSTGDGLVDYLKTADGAKAISDLLANAVQPTTVTTAGGGTLHQLADQLAPEEATLLLTLLDEREKRTAKLHEFANALKTLSQEGVLPASTLLLTPPRMCWVWNGSDCDLASLPVLLERDLHDWYHEYSLRKTAQKYNASSVAARRPQTTVVSRYIGGLAVIGQIPGVVDMVLKELKDATLIELQALCDELPTSVTQIAKHPEGCRLLIEVLLHISCPYEMRQGFIKRLLRILTPSNVAGYLSEAGPCRVLDTAFRLADEVNQYRIGKAVLEAVAEMPPDDNPFGRRLIQLVMQQWERFGEPVERAISDPILILQLAQKPLGLVLLRELLKVGGNEQKAAISDAILLSDQFESVAQISKESSMFIQQCLDVATGGLKAKLILKLKADGGRLWISLMSTHTGNFVSRKVWFTASNEQKKEILEAIRPRLSEMLVGRYSQFLAGKMAYFESELRKQLLG